MCQIGKMNRTESQEEEEEKDPMLLFMKPRKSYAERAGREEKKREVATVIKSQRRPDTLP